MDELKEYITDQVDFLLDQIPAHPQVKEGYKNMLLQRVDRLVLLGQVKERLRIGDGRENYKTDNS